MSMLNILATGMLSRVCCTAATFTTGVLIARGYGKEAVGVYVLVLAARRLIFSITNIGYLTAIVYKYTNNNIMSKFEFIEIIKRVLIICVFSVISINIIVYALPKGYFLSYRSEILTISCLVISSFILNLSQRLASIFKKTSMINISEVFVQISFLIFCGLCVYLEHIYISDALKVLFFLETMVSIFIFYCLIGCLSNLKEKRRELFSVRSLFSYSKWIYVSNWINSLIVDFPVFSMTWFNVPLSGIGIFSRSMTFVNLGRNLLNPMAKIIFPYFREGEDRVVSNYVKVVLSSLVIFLPIMLFIAIYSDKIIVNIYGIEFIEAAEYLKIMTPILLLQPFNVISNVFLTARGSARNVSIFSLSSLVVLITTSAYFYDSLGIKSIAISVLFQQVMIAIIYVFLVMRSIRE